MCLDYRIPKKQIRKYLKGDYIECYSRAYCVSYQYTPRYIPVFGEGFYKRGWNISRKTKPIDYYVSENGKYIPHYHRFLHFRDAQNFMFGDIFLKWKVPIKSITLVGEQMDSIVIITKRCKLIAESKDGINWKEIK